MNKFKAWLIRKLGGYVLPPIPPRIVHKTLPDTLVWGNYPESELWEIDENVQKTGKHYPQIAEIQSIVWDEEEDED